MAFYTDFAGHYEKVFPFRQAKVDFLDRWLPATGRLLDVGCGPGHYCAALVRPERTCLGIDLDPGMISRAQQEHPECDFRIQGMEEIGLLKQGAFAGVFCIGNVLPHLPAPGLVDFILNIKKLLVPGGIWIFQTVNFDPLLRSKIQDYRFPVLRLDDEGLQFHRWYEDIGEDGLDFHTQLVDHGEVMFQGVVRLVPYVSVEYLLGHQAAGFELLGHFADFKEHPFLPAEQSGSVYVWRRG